MTLTDEEKQGRALTAEDAAEYLQISLKTALKLLRSGELPAAKVGRQWRISRQALDDFLAGAGAGKKPTGTRKAKS